MIYVIYKCTDQIIRSHSFQGMRLSLFDLLTNDDVASLFQPDQKFDNLSNDVVKRERERETLLSVKLIATIIFAAFRICSHFYRHFDEFSV